MTQSYAWSINRSPLLTACAVVVCAFQAKAQFAKIALAIAGRLSVFDDSSCRSTLARIMEPISSNSIVSTGSSSNETENVTIVSSSAASRGMLAVFDQQHLSDATVVCGGEQQQRTIYISRAIVAAGSPYFERLFAFNAAACNDQKHGQSAVSGVISWPDHKPEVACAVLQCLYSDTCSFDRSYTDEVLNLAAQVFLNNYKFEALLSQILKASIVRWGCASISFDEKVSMLHRL
jgi:BTB/POZ domain